MSIRIRVPLLSCLLVLVMASLATAAGPSMPKLLEAEFSRYPGSSVYHTMTSEGMVQAILDCGKASIETVAGYYKERASKGGWSISREIQALDMHQLWVTKGKQDGMIAVNTEDGSTFAVLSIFPN